MIISEISQGQKAKYSVSGTVLTVGTVTIDLQERQRSVQNVIDICLDNQLETMAEGLGAWYVATIVIPPLQRQLVPTGEVDENENPKMLEQDLPLDMNRVELRLWGLPHSYVADVNDNENIDDENIDDEVNE